MKKYLVLAMFIVLAVAFVSPFSVSAKTKAGAKPGSFFYFFDTAFEKADLFFTFNPEKKAKKVLEHAEERLAEAEELASENKPEAVKTAMENYKKNIEVLEKVLIKVPEEAKEAIEKAIEASKERQEEVVKETEEKLEKEVSEIESETEETKNELEKEEKNRDIEIKNDDKKDDKKDDQSKEIEKLKKEVEALKQKQPLAPKQSPTTTQNSQEQKKTEEKTVLVVNESEEFKRTLINLIKNDVDSFRFLNKNIDESINIFDSRISMINRFISDNNKTFGLSSEQVLKEIGLLWNEEYKKDMDRSQLFKDSYIEMKNFISQNEIAPLETMAIRITNEGTISKEEYSTELGLINKYDSELNKFHDSIQKFFTRYKSDIKEFDDRYSRIWAQVNMLVSLLNTNVALQNNLNQLRSLPVPKSLNCTFSSHFNGFGTVGSMNCY